MFAEVEDAEGELIDSTMTRVGVRSTPWSGSQLTSSVNREFSEYGPRVFATTGLTQSFKVGAAWAMDVGVDRSDTLTGATAERFNPNVPLVSGPSWKTTSQPTSAPSTAPTSGRSRRASSGATPTWPSAGRSRRLLPRAIEGRALSVTTRWLDHSTALGAGRTVDPQVSYAYRPRDSRLIVLERLDLTQDERVEPLASFETTRFVDNVNFHWQLDNRFESAASRRPLREEHDRRRPTRAGRRCSVWTSAAI